MGCTIYVVVSNSDDQEVLLPYFGQNYNMHWKGAWIKFYTSRNLSTNILLVIAAHMVSLGDDLWQ